MVIAGDLLCVNCLDLHFVADCVLLFLMIPGATKLANANNIAQAILVSSETLILFNIVVCAAKRQCGFVTNYFPNWQTSC